jgi:type II secretory pathway pseudopilin PulG
MLTLIVVGIILGVILRTVYSWQQYQRAGRITGDTRAARAASYIHTAAADNRARRNGRR